MKIIPIKVGRLMADKSEFTYHRNYGIKIQSVCIMWYIDGGEKKIIVDTGPCDPAWTEKYHFRSMLREKDEEPLVALKNRGIHPEEINAVIISHLHWDHAFNNHIFPNAEFFVQRKELQYAIAPLPVHMRGYESIAIGMKPNYIINTKYTIVDGDLEIIPGVSVILTPGHTPGSMAVIVETNKGKWAIAGDTVPLNENWNNPDEHIPHLPSGVFINLMDLCQSMDRLEKEADFVLPSHDLEIFKKEEYP